MTSSRAGILAAISATVIWGLSPIYYKLLQHVPPLEVLAHRTVWSAVIFSTVLLAQRNFRAMRFFLTGWRPFVLLAIAASFISANWGLFILAVQKGWVTETSMGYYMMPLVMVFLGVILLRERLDLPQWIAVGLAGAAVAVLAVGLGSVPWLSIVLAVTFGFYGLIKKRLSVDGTASVTAELLLMAPFALAWLAHVHFGGQGAFAPGRDPATSALLIFSGVISALPLILFSRAAQAVNLATLGLLQYLNPTLQFLCAVAIFGEPFLPVQGAAFGLIWAGLAIYSWQSFRQQKARRRMAMASSADAAL